MWPFISFRKVQEWVTNECTRLVIELTLRVTTSNESAIRNLNAQHLNEIHEAKLKFESDVQMKVQDLRGHFQDSVIKMQDLITASLLSTPVDNKKATHSPRKKSVKKKVRK